MAHTTLLGKFSGEYEVDAIDTMLVVVVLWGTFTIWSQLTDNDGWKILTDKAQIPKRLLQRNGTHLYVFRYSSFSRGLIALEIGYDGEVVEVMLKETYILDTEGLDEVHVSSEINNFIPVIHIWYSTRQWTQSLR